MCKYCDDQGIDFETGRPCCAEEMESLRADIEQREADRLAYEELLAYEDSLEFEL